MTTYTIPAKQSNTGTIHDLARQDESRSVRFALGCQFAVVLASFYGGKGYTTHKTAQAAIRASRKVKAYSHEIIDCAGNRLIVESGYSDDRLVKA
jgi:hypothetical protein